MPNPKSTPKSKPKHMSYPRRLLKPDLQLSQQTDGAGLGTHEADGEPKSAEIVVAEKDEKTPLLTDLLTCLEQITSSTYDEIMDAIRLIMVSCDGRGKRVQRFAEQIMQMAVSSAEKGDLCIRMCRDLINVKPSERMKTKQIKKKNEEDVVANFRMLLLPACLLRIEPSNYEMRIMIIQEVVVSCAGSMELFDWAAKEIIQTAVDKPGKGDLFAGMCRDLASIRLDEPDEEATRFITKLLEKLEESYKQNTDAIGLLDKIAVCYANPTSGKKLNDFGLHKRRMNSIQFVSALHKAELLKDDTIRSCCVELLPQKEDFSDANNEDLETLCTLLQTSGPLVKNQDLLRVPFEKLVLMSQAEIPVLPRISMLIKETIDLRNNNYRKPWKPTYRPVQNRNNDSKGKQSKNASVPKAPETKKEKPSGKSMVSQAADDVGQPNAQIESKDYYIAQQTEGNEAEGSGFV